MVCTAPASRYAGHGCLPLQQACLLKSPQGMGMLHFCIALSRCLESLSQKLYAPASRREQMKAGWVSAASRVAGVRPGAKGASATAKLLGDGSAVAVKTVNALRPPSEPAVTKVPNCGWKLMELTAYTSLPSLRIRGLEGGAAALQTGPAAGGRHCNRNVKPRACFHLESCLCCTAPLGPQPAAATHRWHLKVKFLDCRLSSTWCTATRPSMLPMR